MEIDVTQMLSQWDQQTGNAFWRGMDRGIWTMDFRTMDSREALHVVFINCQNERKQIMAYNRLHTFKYQGVQVMHQLTEAKQYARMGDVKNTAIALMKAQTMFKQYVNDVQKLCEQQEIIQNKEIRAMG